MATETMARRLINFQWSTAIPETITVSEADEDWVPSTLTVSQATFYMTEGGPTATFTVTSPNDTTVNIVQDLEQNWVGEPALSVSP